MRKQELDNLGRWRRSFPLLDLEWRTAQRRLRWRICTIAALILAYCGSVILLGR